MTSVYKSKLETVIPVDLESPVLNSFNYSLVYKKPKIIEMFFSFSMHVFFFHFIQ